MLLTEKAVIKWNPSNREWYTNRGYKYTYWHKEFEVDIKDIAEKSPYELHFICDYCSNKFNMRYSTYHRRYINDKTGKHACSECERLRLNENDKISLKLISNKENKKIKEVLYNVVIDDMNIYFKKCKTCSKYKETSCFKEESKSKHLKIYKDECTECEKDYRLVNENKLKLYHISETSKKMNLPTTLIEKDINRIKGKFNNQCALTKSTDYVFEHFIPVSWGHGGTTLGNIYLLRSDLNLSKGNLNPFTWITNRDIAKEISKKEWKKLIKYLANQNGLSENNFKKYVKWCERNKRTPEQVLKDGKKTSVELWKESRTK